MGSPADDAIQGDGETPIRSVFVPEFEIQTTCVSNGEFARFVADTGFVTTAERHGWSFVFAGLASPAVQERANPSPTLPWWLAVPGAQWRSPEGGESSLLGRSDHPVVHVSWHDATAYSSWADGRLPTEAEWERAARGGRDQTRFPWGDDLEPDGEHRCNVFQGRFPTQNHAEDGFSGTAPVDAFEPNDIGLFNVVGNVWEWCTDVTGPTADPRSADRVVRGGSYLCHHSYCTRYRLGARTAQQATATAGNLGFRVARNVPAR